MYCSRGRPKLKVILENRCHSYYLCIRLRTYWTTLVDVMVWQGIQVPSGFFPKSSGWFVGSNCLVFNQRYCTECTPVNFCRKKLDSMNGQPSSQYWSHTVPATTFRVKTVKHQPVYQTRTVDFSSLIPYRAETHSTFGYSTCYSLFLAFSVPYGNEK